MALITLTTDFGRRDHYVASMKGVILQIDPAAVIVDISHEIAPQQVTEAAFVLPAIERALSLREKQGQSSHDTLWPCFSEYTARHAPKNASSPIC